MEENNKLAIFETQLPTIPGVDSKQTKWLERVRQNPVRLMEQETARQEIAKAVLSIAAYVTQPEDYVITEFAKSFKEAYPLLNPIECAAAVKMQMTGKLGESDNRIFYAGKFNISTMFAILNAYSDWRKSVVAALVNAEDEARREQGRQSQKAAWVEALVVEKVAFLRGEYGTVTTWQDIPPYWFDWAKDNGLFTWETGEKHNRIAAAKIEAENELKAQNENTKQAGRIGEILKGAQFQESVEARALVIQRKRAVWDKIVNKQQ